MFDIIQIIQAEFRFTFMTKRNYIQQTLSHLIEKIIFLIGMILIVLTSDQHFDIAMAIRIAFWFCLVNSFDELAVRIESEIRYHQTSFQVTFRYSYWTQCMIRLLPILLDSFMILICAFLLFSWNMDHELVLGQIGGVQVLAYILVAFIQYMILNLFLICFAIYYKRIQALLGFIEYFVFFYSGLVLAGAPVSCFIFTWMNHLLEGDMIWLLPLAISLFVQICIFQWVKGHIEKSIKTKGMR